MYHSGIGGGGFMLIRAPNNTHEFIDFRETAPAAAFQDMYKNNSDASVLGGLASGVPGEVRGLEYLHKKYGLLPWHTVMQPAIQIARYGFPVTEDLVRYMDSATKGKEDFLTNNPTWALDFAPNGTRLGLGDIITRRRYANTLETIAMNGADAFYSGAIAETMINALQAQNGTMTLDDLKNYTVAVRDTAQIDYRGFKVTSTSAPSSGSILLSALNIVEGYDDFFAQGNVNLSTHRLDEAIRFAYGQRTHMGDPLFVDGLDEFQDKILNKSVSAKIRANISDEHTQGIAAYDPSGFESLETPGTSHMSAIDRTGLAISFTTTVNLYFGSKLMVPETGIIMNNEMNDFSIPGTDNAFGYRPSPSNYVRPGKRPLSSICPTIITHPNGTVYFVTGAAGGSTIITSTLHSIVNVLDRHMTAPQALAEPRFHDQLVPDEIEVEYSFDNSTLAFLQDRKHNITWVELAASTVQSIRVLPNGTFEAAGEPRQRNSGGLAI
ncbi:gamma-glutamyltransferase [Uncinocarpus reesii 1704]|uniref:Gamma-glutamyltransferase n=1 Tax=Uncinocarpus reesii (strain UAMH 1704) TaxID=336963 RepID=C4JPF3_UNCRE|nr:gamma-glutamyltransferase [Uncinocarpus reesii 1704]EEP79689.1 gamma-glutamyltransferase [Uncinocarpus reesii 1704]